MDVTDEVLDDEIVVDMVTLIDSPMKLVKLKWRALADPYDLLGIAGAPIRQFGASVGLRAWANEVGLVPRLSFRAGCLTKGRQRP